MGCSSPTTSSLSHHDKRCRNLGRCPKESLPVTERPTCREHVLFIGHISAYFEVGGPGHKAEATLRQIEKPTVRFDLRRAICDDQIRVL